LGSLLQYNDVSTEHITSIKGNIDIASFDIPKLVPALIPEIVFNFEFSFPIKNNPNFYMTEAVKITFLYDEGSLVSMLDVDGVKLTQNLQRIGAKFWIKTSEVDKIIFVFGSGGFEYNSYSVKTNIECKSDSHGQLHTYIPVIDFA
jgi:hypothetical protein